MRTTINIDSKTIPLSSRTLPIPRIGEVIIDDKTRTVRTVTLVAYKYTKDECIVIITTKE